LARLGTAVGDLRYLTWERLKLIAAISSLKWSSLAKAAVYGGRQYQSRGSPPENLIQSFCKWCHFGLCERVVDPDLPYDQVRLDLARSVHCRANSLGRDLSRKAPILTFTSIPGTAQKISDGHITDRAGRIIARRPFKPAEK
jgi:hypothetical protein